MNQARQGFALATTMLITAAVGIMIAGSLLLATNTLRISSNDAASAQALAAAQAGSAFWRAELVSLYHHMIENFDDYEDEIDNYLANGGKLSCGNYLAIGVDTDRDGSPDVARGSALPARDVPIRIVDGNVLTTALVTVTFTTRGSAIVLDARANANGARARVVDEFNINTIDLWNNAVFADTGAANATIEGRAEIRGSVHILGQGLTDADMALDLTGSFGLGNTYRGINSSLASNLPDLRLTTPDPEDLCATLRVKRGYVNMDGSAHIGYAESANAEPYYDQLKGIYANNNIRGGTLDSNVFSDNGMNAAYDAGNSYDFPMLDDIRPDTGTSWRDELRANSLTLATGIHPNFATVDDRQVLPTVAGDGTVTPPLGGGSYTLGNGDPYLSPGCTSGPLWDTYADGTDASTTYKKNGEGAIATGFSLHMNNHPDFECVKYRISGMSPDPWSDEVITYIKWNESLDEFVIGGTGGGIRFTGSDLLLTGPNSSSARIVYRGEGILFAESLDPTGTPSNGNINLEVDFLPAAGDAVCHDTRGMPAVANCPAGRANTYPASALLGVVSDAQVYSDGAQKRFTAAIYAEDTVKVAKQTLVAGGIVTRSFDAGSNVPTVLYVPNLAQRLSRLMPGAGGRGYAISNVSFSRR